MTDEEACNARRAPDEATLAAIRTRHDDALEAEKAGRGWSVAAEDRAILLAALDEMRKEEARLLALIDAAAVHWMALNLDHPIRFEGAIDGAMEAACRDIRASRKRERALRDALREIASCDMHFPGDVVGIARAALAAAETSGFKWKVRE